MGWSCSVSFGVSFAILHIQILTLFHPGNFCFMTLSPTKLPSPTKETSKYTAACKEILLAEETPEDHPDIRKIRKRVAGNLKEMEDLGWI